MFKIKKQTKPVPDPPHSPYNTKALRHLFVSELIKAVPTYLDLSPPIQLKLANGAAHVAAPDLDTTLFVMFTANNYEQILTKLSQNLKNSADPKTKLLEASSFRNSLTEKTQTYYTGRKSRSDKGKPRPPAPTQTKPAKPKRIGTATKDSLKTKTQTGFKIPKKKQRA